VFVRENLDLKVTVPIPYYVAVCGGEVEIPSPEGVFIYKVPEGTANGEIVRFRGKGIKTARGANGDLYATLMVEVPKNVNSIQKQRLKDFENGCSTKNYSKRKEFADEVSKLYTK
jgi:molecular chaperone DnaJ